MTTAEMNLTDKSIDTHDRAYLFGLQRARDGFRPGPHALMRSMVEGAIGESVEAHTRGEGWCEVDSYMQGMEDVTIWADTPLRDVLADIASTRDAYTCELCGVETDDLTIMADHMKGHDDK